MLLVLFYCLLKRLPFLRHNRFEGFVLLPAKTVERVLRNPGIMFIELAKERLSSFRSVLHRCQACVRVLARCQAGEYGRYAHESIFLYRAFFIRVGVRLLVVVFPPKRL